MVFPGKNIQGASLISSSMPARGTDVSSSMITEGAPTKPVGQAAQGLTHMVIFLMLPLRVVATAGKRHGQYAPMPYQPTKLITALHI